MDGWRDASDRLTQNASRVAGALASASISELDDDALTTMLCDATGVRDAADVVIAAASAEVARRSAYERGNEGLARRNGHRSARAFVQQITGQDKADVSRALRAGEDLLGGSGGSFGGVGGAGGGFGGVAGGAGGLGGLDGAGAVGGDSGGAGGSGGAEGLGGAEGSGGLGGVGGAAGGAPVEATWVGLLRDALASGRVNVVQHQAIRQGLGEPPLERYPDTDPRLLIEAWARAAEILLDEARDLAIPELRAAARTARDRLDPVGVTLRFEERYASRSCRVWTDDLGQKHARLDFDDESAAWFEAVMVAALRGRSGPRFVGEDAADKNAEAKADTRTSEQLQFDHVIATLRTGAGADPSRVFGERQPGVRIVVESDAITVGDDGMLRVTGVGHLQDGGQALPGPVIEKYLCDTGTLPVLFDGQRRPLDLGREKRLFQSKQRTAIAVRDGGCIGVGCNAPASQVEIHHIGEWWADHGHTDVDDGVPLCRGCHLHVHNTGARIVRTRNELTGLDEYWMHYPPDPVTGAERPPRQLRSRSPRRFAAA